MTNKGATTEFSQKSNSISCGKSDSTVSLDGNCRKTESGDPFDIMGKGLYATDINCYHKMKLGWITPTESATMEVPDINSADFKPADAKRTTTLNSIAY